MDAELFAAALIEWEDALDWDLLGRLYCHEGGEHFFPPEQRDALRETGLRLADDLAGALGSLPEHGPGRSLYVGAGVAELAPILSETFVLGREVVWCSLLGEELDELARAAAVAEVRLGVPLPRGRPCGPSEVDGPVDHLWLVSVVSDPQTYPSLSAELYGRPRAEREAAAERARADAVVDAALARLGPHAVLTTTDVELPLVAAACGRGARRLEVPERARLSGVVGDAVSVCRVTPAR